MAYIGGLSVAGCGVVLWWQGRLQSATITRTSPGAGTPRLSIKTPGSPSKAAADAPSMAPQDASLSWSATWRKFVSVPTRHPLGLLMLAAASSGLLCAVQMLPTEELSNRSTRGNDPVPRNLYELASGLLSNHQSPAAVPGRQASPPWYLGLLGKQPITDQHHLTLYNFSVGPWRMIEYFFPNVSGRQFPTHCRWLDGVRAEGPVWVPSLYM